MASLLAALAGADPLLVLGQIVTGAVGLPPRPSRDAEPCDAAHLHRACRGRRLPRKALEHRGRGAAYAGAIIAVLLGTGALGAPFVLPITALAAMVAGGLLLLGPALLKVRLGVDEVVTTLLFNFICLLLL